MFGKKFKAGRIVSIQPAVLGKKNAFSLLVLKGKGKWETAFTGKIKEVRTIAKGYGRAGFKFSRSLKVKKR